MTTTKECRNGELPSSFPMPDDGLASDVGGGLDWELEESAEYGVILVNNYRNQRASSGWVSTDSKRSKGIRRNANDRCGGYRRTSSAKNRDAEHESITDRFTEACRVGSSMLEWISAAIGVDICCGKNFSENASHSTPATQSMDSFEKEKFGYLPTHPQSFQQHDNEISLLTDVSVLTDASLMDLVLSKEDEDNIEKEMAPNKGDHCPLGNDLPAFHKKSKRNHKPSNYADLLVEEGIGALKKKQREREEYLHPRLPHAIVAHDDLNETKKTKKNKKGKASKSQQPLKSRTPTWTKKITSLPSLGNVFKKKKKSIDKNSPTEVKPGKRNVVVVF
ncbi:unnamed protein product [Pseudo-nitzschia multistriata]|uniref:Uncharacterized protein n=1 Tax=Pseudo-nitzschia multistriata TaxID=183589 RepID=A0A448ZLN5_9STRA|nr:unnamed protein product [Pseudo-nitzschia multistriata]